MHLPVLAAACLLLLGCHRVLSCSEQPAQTLQQLLPENQQHILESHACALADLHEPCTAQPWPIGSLCKLGQGTAPNTHLLLQAKAEGEPSPQSHRTSDTMRCSQGHSCASAAAGPPAPHLPTQPGEPWGNQCCSSTGVFQ